jgi:hypothetical protein
MTGGVVTRKGLRAPAPTKDGGPRKRAQEGPRRERVRSEPKPLPPLPPLTLRQQNLRRFTGWVLTGFGVGAVSFLWVLWVLFSEGRLRFLRLESNGNFYDAQAWSILHGHLYLRKRVLTIEGFWHAGHWYTYFGIFPSLIRIPVLWLLPSFYGRMTGLSILAAWMVTSLFSALLIWRVRVMIRGSAVLGNGEAISYGVLMAVITGGSVLLLLATPPWVYNEDLSWGVALTVGALFGMAGILERPTRWRVLLAGVFTVFANLNRAPTGFACIGGLALIGIWMALGWGGPERRRWAWQLISWAVVAFALGVLINMLKFGVPVGINLGTQRWTQLNAHRREFLVLNKGAAWGFKFVPTTLWTYFQPFGIRLQDTFPFVTLPPEPPEVIGGAVFDLTYRTASVPASMPLLFILACWGTACSFFRTASDKARLFRIPLVASACAFSVSIVWGYIAPRFEGDLLPFLIIGAAVGTAHLWRQLEHRPRLVRRIAFGAVVVFGIFCIVANQGIADIPSQEWTNAEMRNYVTVQRNLSNITGHPLVSQITTGRVLPYYEPAGKLFIVGNCAGLYVSDGELFNTVPVQQQEHQSWIPVERGAGSLHLFRITAYGPADRPARTTLVSVGPDKIFVQYSTPKDGKDTIQFGIERPGLWTFGRRYKIKVGQTKNIALETDTNMHYFDLALGKHYGFYGLLPSSGPVIAYATPPLAKGATPPPFLVQNPRSPKPQLELCQSLLKQVRESRLAEGR